MELVSTPGVPRSDAASGAPSGAASASPSVRSEAPSKAPKAKAKCGAGEEFSDLVWSLFGFWLRFSIFLVVLDIFCWVFVWFSCGISWLYDGYLVVLVKVCMFVCFGWWF